MGFFGPKGGAQGGAQGSPPKGLYSFTSLGSKATQELKKMISALVKNKLERVEINLANTSTTKLIFVLFFLLT